MTKISKKDLELLAKIIIANLQEEFALKKLSGNLINTIKVENYRNSIKIHIPAETYNMLLYQQKGVIVHTSHGSYASKLDEEGSSFFIYNEGQRKGSFRISPRNHKGYVDQIINKSIEYWVRVIQSRKIAKEIKVEDY